MTRARYTKNPTKVYRLTTIAATVSTFESFGKWHAWIDFDRFNMAETATLGGHGVSERAALADLIRKLHTLIKEIDGL